MIEVVLLDFLKESGLEAPVYSEVPKEPPSSFYTIEKTGSSLNNHIYSSTFAIQSYGASLYEAASMNEALKNVMLDGFLANPLVSNVELNSDYNFTDITEKRYRYQAVFDIVHY